LQNPSVRTGQCADLYGVFGGCGEEIRVISFIHKGLRQNKLQRPFQLPLLREAPNFSNLMKGRRDRFLSPKSKTNNVTDNKKVLHIYSSLIDDFASITGIKPVFDKEYKEAVLSFCSFLSSKKLRPLKTRCFEFISYMNKKFRLNSSSLAAFYKSSAEMGYTFNYHQKQIIQSAFDSSDISILSSHLKDRRIPKDKTSALLSLFLPIKEKDTLQFLRSECKDPSKLRTARGSRNIKAEIIKSQFSSFLYTSLNERFLHSYFDCSFKSTSYESSFWKHLHNNEGSLFDRQNALHFLTIDQTLFDKCSDLASFRSVVSHFVERSFTHLNNYGFLCIFLKPLRFMDRSIEWELAADIILFSEKFRSDFLEKYYFQSERIKKETNSYIKELDSLNLDFSRVNEGFTYKDTFVFGDSSNLINGVLLVLQKNQRDETLIPCPKCRSSDVQGNSYPSLGVRSWECSNLLCPDRSKYNRGKRYSFKALMMQQAIEDDLNQIPSPLVKKWKRDVLLNVSSEEANEMVLRFFSMNGDTARIFNSMDFKDKGLGRFIKHEAFEYNLSPHPFWNSVFFHKYLQLKKSAPEKPIELGDASNSVINGDSLSVLKGFPDSSFDGAVTSPPYYNAREYSQWPNIFCYLYDIYNINKEVFRTLKPGSIFLFNIFDYFDNENVVAFSAMGQKRMILSAYTVDLFRRIGFVLHGNIVWDKCEIEGKRAFNAGNFSPFYQSPLNCWEHIFIFYKPGSHSTDNLILKSGILPLKPVLKMVRGKNTHGHSAPFPDQIPELLASHLSPSQRILDPFAGSLTTGRVAKSFGIKSTCIEKSLDYCKLGTRIMADNESKIESLQLALI